MLTLSGLRYRWPGRAGFDLSVPGFHLARGDTVLLVGSSGSGKSTLLSLICGTILADEGRVEVDGTDLRTLSARGRDRFRAERIGVIFQQFNLLPYAGVLDNILLPLTFAPERRKRLSDPALEAARLCAAMGVPEEMFRQRAARLSVGQQQRVAAARALIGAPGLILADEPTSALDARAQNGFLDLLFSQVEQSGSTLLFVSHDERLAPRFDRVVSMEHLTGANPDAATAAAIKGAAP